MRGTDRSPSHGPISKQARISWCRLVVCCIADAAETNPHPDLLSHMRQKVVMGILCNVRVYADHEFHHCSFRYAPFASSHHPNDRPVVRNSKLVNCEARAPRVNAIVVEDCLIENLKPHGSRNARTGFVDKRSRSDPSHDTPSFTGDCRFAVPAPAGRRVAASIRPRPGRIQERSADSLVRESLTQSAKQADTAVRAPRCDSS